MEPAIRDFPSLRPKKYLEISPSGVSFSEVVISIGYKDNELN
jgi:hypothetical protein